MVIHSGTAQGGHYYSYIKVKNGTNGEKDVWLEFNDTTVREFPYASKFEESCFGGKRESKKSNSAFGSWGYEKSSSAYVCFYERELKTDLNIVVNNQE